MFRFGAFPQGADDADGFASAFGQMFDRRIHACLARRLDGVIARFRIGAHVVEHEHRQIAGGGSYVFAAVMRGADEQAVAGGWVDLPDLVEFPLAVVHGDLYDQAFFIRREHVGHGVRHLRVVLIFQIRHDHGEDVRFAGSQCTCG